MLTRSPKRLLLQGAAVILIVLCVLKLADNSRYSLRDVLWRSDRRHVERWQEQVALATILCLGIWALVQLSRCNDTHD
jgi:putative copper export protein